MGATWAAQNNELRQADGGPPRWQSRQTAAGSRRFGPPNWRSWTVSRPKAASLCSLRARKQSSLVRVGVRGGGEETPGVSRPPPPQQEPLHGDSLTELAPWSHHAPLESGKRLPTPERCQSAASATCLGKLVERILAAGACGVMASQRPPPR
ncbi:hypothetical protein TraAM80_05597 [Trypanosoma rangeli]|uniref:Uncharacterized protein n=1 Tax=Trypanosoma rangeli TaxID=5698 RepID=A0A3R7KCB3_TRYRA|nr:uncharacterized protein TraAM80_05597 [Trypanosoma rangeli]RNF03656.1 hypothetical protein TraAM80_05597 [Trypanosoma rangeli]|eukprot:RNF03656.1 hypothetical protein TraAM80_05597 [Trypanosoma rangeli]